MKKKLTLKLALQLTLNKYNATIKERMNEIYIIWDINPEVARDIIKKMYYREFNELTDVEEQRLILHNLVCSELDANNKEVTNSSKKWSRDLIAFLNTKTEYVEINLEKYTSAMNNYIYTHKDELDNKELIVAYEKYYKVFEKYEYIERGSDDDIKKYVQKMNAKFDLNLIKGNFNIVLEIFEDMLIHNDNHDCGNALNYFLKDTKEVNVELHNQMLLLLQQGKDIQNKIS